MNSIKLFLIVKITTFLVYLIDTKRMDPFNHVNVNNFIHGLLLDAWCLSKESKNYLWRTRWFLKLDSTSRKNSFIDRALLRCDDYDPNAFIFILTSVFRDKIRVDSPYPNVMQMSSVNDTLELACRFTHMAVSGNDIVRQEQLDMIDYVFSDAVWRHNVSPDMCLQLRIDYSDTLNHLPQTRLTIEGGSNSN